MEKQVLFLTLKVFSATGGIEKVCRTAGKALYEYGTEYNVPVKIMCMHDAAADATGNAYFPSEIFYGCGAGKIGFMRAAVKAGIKSGTVILSHINLLPAAWLIKKFAPRVRILMFSHGLELWQPLSASKKKMLSAVDTFICVSSFTAAKLQELQQIPKAKCTVLNNCIDPFLPLPQNNVKNAGLMKRYGLSEDDIVLFTLTRLSATDRYKGYMQVIESVAALIKKYPHIKYLLAGKYEAEEKNMLDTLIKQHGLEAQVIFTGFVAEEELAAHFSIATIYIMPSTMEGFGIVFAEAMYYGIPAIAANVDGSVDALINGALGLLTKPDTGAVTAALETMIMKRNEYLPDHELLMQHFGYERYKNELEKELRMTNVQI